MQAHLPVSLLGIAHRTRRLRAAESGGWRVECQSVRRPAVWQRVSFTDEPTVQYNVGGNDSAERHTEYGRPDARRADLEGHTSPRISGIGLGLDVGLSARASLPPGAGRYRNGSGGNAQPLADRNSGACSSVVTTIARLLGWALAAIRLVLRPRRQANVDFVPPTYAGVGFTSAHEHYVAIAGGLMTAAVFADIEAELAEHGHLGPLRCVD